MTIPKRLLTVILLAAVLLTGAVLLRPTETTLAAWTDEVTVPVGSLQTGGVRMDVQALSGDGARVAMAGDVGGTWRPATVRVNRAGGGQLGSELLGSRVEYRLAAADGSCRGGDAPIYTAQLDGAGLTAPVTGGERLEGARTLCLTFVPSDRTRIEHGGTTLTLTTTLDGVSVAPATWTATGTWAADQQLPAGPSVAGPTCSSSWLNPTVTLRWDWDRAGLSQDVARWSLQTQDGNSWREVRSVAAGDRSTVVRASDFNLIQFSSHTLRVVAVLPDGIEVPSTQTTRIKVERLLLGSVSCD